MVLMRDLGIHLTGEITMLSAGGEFGGTLPLLRGQVPKHDRP